MVTGIVVGDYAASRGKSESTVKAWIREEGWELEQLASDKRKRVLTPQQVLALDEKYGVSAKAPSIPTSEPETYHRSETVAEIIIQGELIDAQVNNSGLVKAEENPLLLALQQQQHQTEQQASALRAKFGQQATSFADGRRAIRALRQQQLVQLADRDAVEDMQIYTLRYQQTSTQLEMQAAGLQPAQQAQQEVGQPEQDEEIEAAKKPSPENQEWLV
jgi:hypothetical protein